MALARLCRCAGSSEPWLFANAITTKHQNHVLANNDCADQSVQKRTLICDFVVLQTAMSHVKSFLLSVEII